MCNTDNARKILILRYSKLSNQSIDKINSKLESKPIDDVIVKHEKTVTFSIVLIVLTIVALIAQFVTIYYSKSISLGLIANVLILIIFQKGLHDNYEIRHILKALKATGLQ